MQRVYNLRFVYLLRVGRLSWSYYLSSFVVMFLWVTAGRICLAHVMGGSLWTCSLLVLSVMAMVPFGVKLARST